MSTEPRSRERSETAAGSQLFREEALRRHLETREFGDVLRMPPRWTRYSYPWVAVMALAGLLLLVFGRVSQYARGPAVVLAEERQDVISTVTGTVASVEIEPGMAVEEGRLLLRLNSDAERAALARVRDEFETLLAERLRDPSNEATARALLPLRADLVLARKRVEAREIRAPRAGVVQEVRVRAAQSVREGDVVVAMAPEGTAYSVLSLLPASYLPELRPGQPLRVDVTGYPHASVRVEIAHLGDQAVGPAEARRAIGSPVADTIDIPGPVVLATARLPGTTFRALQAEYEYHDGMVAASEVPVRTERILFALLPGLRAAFVD